MNGAYRPLFLTLLSLEGRFVGFHPFGFRLFSILLHLANGLLLLFLAHRYFRLPVPWAFMVSLLFLLHPIQSTALALVWKQSDLWIAFFALSSLLFLQDFPLASFLLFLISPLTKESALAIPLVWLGFERILSEKERKKRFLLTGLAVSISIIFYEFLLPLLPHGIPSSGDSLGPLDYFKSQLHALPFYFLALVNPSQITLERTFVMPLNFPILGSLILIFFFLILIYRRKSKSSIALLMAAFFLLSTSSFHPLSLLYDETRLYLSIGFALIALFCELPELRSTFYRGAGTILLILLVAANWMESSRWSSEEILWKKTLEIEPNSPRAHYQLGWIADGRREWETAEIEYQMALRILPEFDKARLALGILLGRMGKLEEAKNEFQFLLGHAPYWKARGDYHLGLAAMYQKDWKCAEDFFDQADRWDPAAHLGVKGRSILAGSRNVR